MIGKFILPWFGGTPAVWTTVMLFFQVLLTGGYAYAYWLIGRIRAERQPIIHMTLIAVALILLVSLSFVWTSPVTPDSSWKPQAVSSPILDIFKLLMVSVGLPYFILAANGPLMQAWFSRLFPERSYARLYALSNAGSLLGLLAYPILIEPVLSLRLQGWTWAAGFIIFGLLVVWIAVRIRGVSPRAQSTHLPLREPHKPDTKPDPVVAANRLSFGMSTLWIALSATASLFLLSVTNQITQEVAVIPFLWVLPLALYLLSFILTFSGEHGYQRKFYAILFIISTALTLFVMLRSTSLQVYWQVIAYCSLLFTACILCHGELYLLRPAAQYLTTFYLMVSIGGAIGGVFVSLIAPLIFNAYQEFFVGLAMTLALTLMIFRSKQNTNVFARARFIFVVFASVTIMLPILGVYFSGVLYTKRNFYGVLRVRETIPAGSTKRAYLMSHGITVHGLQFIDPALRLAPTTYYVRDSGAGLAILNQPRYGQDQRVGMLGAGVGTLVTYGQPGDTYRLYEINPAVVALAEGQDGYFSFVKDSKANVTMILGDARISLERELAEGYPQNFDVLVLDTFSSDSIPIHLVTKEAFALYLDHLATEGIIAAHISNRHLDLQPVFWGLARYYGLRMVRVNYPGDANGGYPSDWILLARDAAVLEVPAIQARTVSLDGYSTDLKLWTDDYSNLFQILK